MIIFSHRGNGFGKKENSLEAFKRCIEEGYSLELDIQTTKDGELVLYHDKYIEVFNKKILLNRVNYQDLNKRVDKFEDFLKLFDKYKSKEILFAIHIKNENQEDILEQVVEKLSKHNLLSKSFIFGVTLGGRKLIKNLNKEAQVGFSLSEKKYASTIYTLDRLRKENFEVVWLDEWKENALYKKDSIDSIKELNSPIYAISPELHKLENHASSGSKKKIYELWKNLANFEVQGICTDYPRELKNLISNIAR